jgi:hypothetical protein
MISSVISFILRFWAARSLRGWIALAIFFFLPGLLISSALHSWTWLFAVRAALVVLGIIIGAFGRGEKRSITPHELADELERHLVGSEGQYDWDHTTSVEVTNEKLNRLVSRLPEYDRLDTPEKRDQFRALIEALRRGEIPD